MKKADLIIYTDTLVTCRGDGKPKRGDAMKDAGVLTNGGVVVEDGIIIETGPQKEIKDKYIIRSEGLELHTGENPVLPGFIDSHTHPVFAGNRINEFILRAQGASYQEIHQAGGGIQFTVDQTASAPDHELLTRGEQRLMRMLRHGTTTIEAKSGYGLDTAEELRELSLIKELSAKTPLDIVSTFLGAHSLPKEYKTRREDFILKVIKEMLPQVKERGLAEFVDVFCEEGAFTLEETRRILQAGADLGFGLKLHAEEFSNLGSAIMAAEMGAVSVDHLLCVNDEDIEYLAKTDTILTLMPGTLFFLNMKKYAPARAMIDKGAAVALATDFNAGSCMSESMQIAVSLGCIAMKMTPEEAFNAACYNASFAISKSKETGSIETGKNADLVIYDIEDYRLIPYHFGVNLAKTVIKKGRVEISQAD